MRPRQAAWPARRAPTGADLLLVGLLAAAVPLARAPGPAPGDRRLVVRAGGQERVADARRDQDIAIDGPAGSTVVRVRGGAAWIAAAPCRGRLCQRMGRIRAPGRALVCMPNRVLVRFAGSAEDVDAIAR